MSTLRTPYIAHRPTALRLFAKATEPGDSTEKALAQLKLKLLPIKYARQGDFPAAGIYAVSAYEAGLKTVDELLHGIAAAIVMTEVKNRGGIDKINDRDRLFTLDDRLPGISGSYLRQHGLKFSIFTVGEQITAAVRHLGDDAAGLFQPNIDAKAAAEKERTSLHDDKPLTFMRKHEPFGFCCQPFELPSPLFDT